MSLYVVFHKFLFRFSEILVVNTFLKSEFFGRVGPVGLGPPLPGRSGRSGRVGRAPGRPGRSGRGPGAAGRAGALVPVGSVVSEPAGRPDGRVSGGGRVPDEASC